MNLEECLQSCTWTRLWAIGHARGLDVPRQPTKADLRDLLGADLARGQVQAHDLHHLPPDALVALQLLALHGGWLPVRDFQQRFGSLRTFKPWRQEAPPEDAPWRAPASTTELLWYRGLIYAHRQAHSYPERKRDGFCLPDEIAAVLPPAQSAARAVAAPSSPPEAPNLFYNLALFHAHLERGDFAPRQQRWLTPRQFRPLLDRLWPPDCTLLAADRNRRGERATRLLRALHFIAEAAEFLPAPALPPRRLRLPRLSPTEDVARMVPLPPDKTSAAPQDTHLPQKIVLPHETQQRSPSRLLPTPFWHRWLDASPLRQLAILRPVLGGRAENQDRRWRI